MEKHVVPITFNGKCMTEEPLGNTKSHSASLAFSSILGPIRTQHVEEARILGKTPVGGWNT